MDKNTAPPKVPKSRADQLRELIDSLQLTNEAIRRLHSNESRYLMVLSTQLRKLIAESRSNKSLLQFFANDFNKKLTLYCMPELGEEQSNDAKAADILDQAVIHITGFPITPHKVLPRQREVELKDIVKRKIISVHGRTYTPRTVIKWYADKIGAHSDPSLESDFHLLLTHAQLSKFLIQLGIATVAAGIELLKEQMDQAFIAHIVFDPDQPDRPRKVFLYDAIYKTKPMRLSFSLNSLLIPEFRLTGLHGRGCMIVSDRIVDWSTPKAVWLSVQLTRKLTTRISLEIDGVEVAFEEIDDVIFLPPDTTWARTTWNREVNGQVQNFSFGVIRHLVFKTTLSAVERGLVYEELQNNDQEQVETAMCLYKPNGYGHSDLGTTNLTIESAIRTTVGEWLSAQGPSQENE